MPGNYFSNPNPQFFDANGDPLNAGKIEFFEAGSTTTDQDTFTDKDLSSGNENDNPIILNSDGRPATAIFLQHKFYNIRLLNSANTVIWARDNFLGDSTAASIVDVKRDHLAIGDGVTDDTVAMQAAVDSGAKVVFFPDGTYKFTSLAVPVGVSLEGASISGTILDASASSETTVPIIDCAGALTAIANLTSNVTVGSDTLEFVSDMSSVLSRGDVVVIHNPTNNSFNSFRTSYQSGEYLKVQNVSTTTVTIVGGVYAAYTAANVNIYRLDGTSGHIRDLTILGPEASTTPTLRLLHGKSFHISQIRVTGTGDRAVQIERSYDVDVSHSTIEHLENTLSGLDYGIAISNCQAIRIHHNNIDALRHAVTTGGGSGNGVVPNREIKVDHNTLRTHDVSPAMDFHGNTEHSQIDNNTIIGGFSVGGDFIEITNNQVVCFVSGGQNQTALTFTEIHGLNWLIANNQIKTQGGTASRGAFIDIGGNDSSTLTSSTVNGGTFVVNNNRFEDLDTSPASSELITIRNRGFTGVMNLEIVGNTLLRAASYDLSIFTDAVSGSNFDAVRVERNALPAPVSVSNADEVFVHDNNIDMRGLTVSKPGLFVSKAAAADNYISVIGNVIRGSRRAGMDLTGNADVGTLILANNLVWEFDLSSGGTAGLDSGIAIRSFETAMVTGNVVKVGTGGTALDEFWFTDTGDGMDVIFFGNIGDVTINGSVNFLRGPYIDAGGNLVMPQLPTSTPGGSDRVWNNSNVLNIT